MFHSKSAPWPPTTYRPRLVTQVVDGLEGVDARDASILQTDYHVAKIFILSHTEGMLTDEDEVRLERPGKCNYCKYVTKLSRQMTNCSRCRRQS